MKYLIYFFLGFTVFATSCITTNISSKNVDAKSDNHSETIEITSKEWRLVSVDSLTTENVKRQTTLKIETDGKVHGQGGCNNFSGVAIINGANIKFDKLVTTLSACLDMKIETTFLKALEETDSYIIESKLLKLKKGNTVIATLTVKN
jgi:heat shock protein HslJ